MKQFEINPLTVLGERRLVFLPLHITPIAVKSLRDNSLYYDRNMIIDWIESNLKGRYFIGSLTKLDNDRIVQYEAVGFEDPHESTFFLLGYSGQK